MLSASTAAGQGIVVLKYDPAGKLLWQDIFPLTFGGAVRPSTDTSGNVYVLGSASGSGSGWLSTAFGNVATYLGATTEKYAPDGTLVCSTLAQIPTRGAGIKLGSGGSVFVVADGPQALLHYTQDGTGTAPPTAVASRMLEPEPLTVNFSSAGSTGAIVGYRWNLGDGTGSVEASPTRVFAAGTFATTLTVTDNRGGTASSAPSLFTVTLTSSAPNVASVPAIILVPVGANSASFTVKTTKLRRSTTAVTPATTASASASAPLTVTKE